MAIDKKIIKSFYLQDELNPDVWDLPNERYMGDEEAQNYKLKPLNPFYKIKTFLSKFSF